MVKRRTPELDELIASARSFLKERGAVQRLADCLGVAHSTLSDWLRGRFEPGGEVTLMLRKWVVAEEAKHKKKTPAVLLARSGRLTRKDNDEKAKSDRPEG